MRNRLWRPAAIALLGAAPLWPSPAPGQGAPIPLLPPSVTAPTPPPYQGAPVPPYRAAPPAPYQAPAPAPYSAAPSAPSAEQSGPIIATPLPPPAPAAPSAPSSAFAPTAQAPTAQAPGQAAEAQPPAQPEAPPRYPNVWVPEAAARLLVMNKVDSVRKELTVKVGQSASYGALTISVRSCLVRPPDQPADATAFLVISDSHKNEPGFSGWTLANEPWLSMLQNPVYNVSVVGCQS